MKMQALRIQNKNSLNNDAAQNDAQMLMHFGGVIY